MTRLELLDNIVHKNLRVRPHFDQGSATATGMLPAYPTEFAELQREYAIFLRHEPGSGEL